MKPEPIKGLRAFYAYVFLFDFLPFLPIIIAYEKGRGLSYTAVTILQAAYYLSFFVLEVPTGALADLVGLRLPLICAGGAMAAAAVRQE